MAFYRVYFLDGKNGIAAREEFAAPGNQAANEICRVIADACSESCKGYEIWSAARLVSRVPDVSSVPVGLPSWAEIERRRQHSILEIEERLHLSRGRVAASKRLIEKTSDLRAFLRAPTPSIHPSTKSR